MSLHIQLTHEPLAVAAPGFPATGESGAWLDFYGVVRGTENGATIPALDYEAYEAMAERELKRLLSALMERHAVQEVWLTHRLGRVPVGEPSLHLRVRSAHRNEAIVFVEEAILQLKQRVPIWKRPAR